MKISRFTVGVYETHDKLEKPDDVLRLTKTLHAIPVHKILFTRAEYLAIYSVVQALEHHHDANVRDTAHMLRERIDNGFWVDKCGLMTDDEDERHAYETYFHTEDIKDLNGVLATMRDELTAMLG